MKSRNAFSGRFVSGDMPAGMTRAEIEAIEHLAQQIFLMVDAAEVSYGAPAVMNALWTVYCNFGIEKYGQATVKQALRHALRDWDAFVRGRSAAAIGAVGSA